NRSNASVGKGFGFHGGICHGRRQHGPESCAPRVYGALWTARGGDAAGCAGGAASPVAVSRYGQGDRGGRRLGNPGSLGGTRSASGRAGGPVGAVHGAVAAGCTV